VARIADAGIARVVAAVQDPNPLVRGRGFAFLESRGITVDVGTGRAAAVLLNQPFFTLMNEGRPFVTLKAAISADGCISEAPGRRTALTSGAANRHAQRIRAEIDAIGVGVGTILADDPLLTCTRRLSGIAADSGDFRPRFAHAPGGACPLDSRGRPCHDLDAGRGGRPGRAPPATRSSRCHHRRDRRDDSRRAPCARRSQRHSLLLEGGARVHEAAWMENVVDYVRLYATPKSLGPQGLKFLNGRRFSAAELIEPRVESLGPDVMTEGYVHGPR
jgi:diaminohydroxyphosphoribosylaminopyrimidine deaminase/5-amino-6-(5-phosphoribosylamino)uracil reductase